MSVKVMALVYDIKLGCALRKAVALKLADCSDDAGRNIWPAVETIADKAEVSRRSVQIKLGEMVAAGLIRIVQAGGGRNSPTHYEFDMAVVYALAEGRETFAGRLANGARAAPFDGDAEAAENGAGNAPFISETAQLTTRNPAGAAPEPSGTEDSPPKSPAGGPVENLGTKAGTSSGPGARQPGHELLLDDLRCIGRHLDAIDHLLAPLLAAGQRLAIGRGAEARAVLAEMASKAHGLPQPVLAAVARRLIDQAGKVTPAHIATAIAVARKAGAMVAIRRGSQQWAAWARYYAETDPKRGMVMERFDGWQVPSEWPPRAAAVAADERRVSA